jgi:flagellar M-ring protein FliF
MNFLQKVAIVWQKISLVQRATLAAITLTLCIIVGFLVHWARKPDMRMLYQGLPPAEASQITEKIGDKDIAYELRESGTTIYVPREYVYQLRLDMAKEGLPTGQQSGYKIFDNEKIGVSPFVQNVNLKRALQDELAKSIQMIDGVVHARVHIVSSDQTLFASEAEKTTASVVLKLRPGYQLSATNVAAITHLVSGSVEGVSSENVTVIDSQGHLLSGSGDSDHMLVSGVGTVQDYREKIEQNLARKVEEMLTTVLGPGRAAVRVSAVVDMNSVSTVTETYDPTAKVVKKEEIKTNIEEDTAQATAGAEPATPGSKKKDEEILTEYEIGKTVKQEIILPGEIKSLSVAAFVDLSAPDANEAEAAGQPAMIMQLSDVEQIIRNALGLEETDLLKVVHAKFHRPTELLTEQEPSNWPRYVAIARHASLAIAAVCALLVLRIFSSARKKAAATAGAAQLPGTEEAVGLLPPGHGGAEPLMLRRQIANALQNNPEQVRQLFSSWIQQKES